jgi:RNA polymerase sigma-70 factor (ECF subfamily)
MLSRSERDVIAEPGEDLDTARLVTRLQAGEDEAFEHLYLRYFDRVYAYLRVSLRDAHEAEDAAQQVFLKLYEALPRYERRHQPFRAWMFTIARNEAVDRLRKRGAVDVEDPAALSRRRDSAANHEALGPLRWMSDDEMLLLIERLSPLQRQVLLLRYMMDLSCTEVAEVLGRSPESVRQLQHRALEFLRGRLQSLGRQPARRFARHPMRRCSSHRLGRPASTGSWTAAIRHAA